MPLFHDPHRRRQYRLSGDRGDHEQPAGESPQGEPYQDSEPILDRADITGVNLESTPADLYPTKMWANDRQQIIHRIKESSPWRRQYMPQTSDNSEQSLSHNSPEEVSQRTERTEQQPSRRTEDVQQTNEIESPADIQRPRSALHSGDFREGIPHGVSHSPRTPFAERNPTSAFPRLGTSPTTPWFAAPAFGDPSRDVSTLGDHREPLAMLGNRARAPSLGSFSSSYVLKAPTSPLVHQANNTDLDFSPRVSPAESTPFERASRRRTLPPETFRQLEGSPPPAEFINMHSPCPSRQPDGFHNFPCSPRRSLTSAYSLQLASTANTTPAYRARRPSLVSDISPKPHAPMVGSYEESILRGRMSMNPSKPLDFTAQIGVLGKGNCKGHLKCPPHVTVPFPAFFYSYPTSGSGRSISDDSPSPYVGHIDLENSLSKDDVNATRRRRRHVSPSKSRESNIPGETSATRMPSAETQRRREKKSRRAESPQKSPGRIIIKNPHKTAVKLFLVPYDLDDMEPGTKTFIRQRSYSAGPVLDMPLSARKNYGTDRPEASLNSTEDPQDKPTLRYLIHLNICCPARGRFYLHSSIRVVFANRVPDGKEKLRNEIQLPEPRYSPYKPCRDPTISTSAGARLATDKASRRRSVGQDTIPLLRPHATFPGDFSPHWSPGQTSDMLYPPGPTQFDPGIYNKLNKHDFGYGRYPYPSSPSTSENGESLLAKRLRALDVQRREKFENS
ncbi:hypothetical protein N7481_009484 [Penicillium waksmanii]|uniref:uncharacterized protein n=1 Tax=Penicillium waksmanii TaxID=69791 RepID=UPI00254785F9|nr:uncharacterized protein N7481_009484 [Penicillium waksmanii]KAJ5975777.1 hypothetical protein N7481_009484 [Penicillium waksmanii]